MYISGIIASILFGAAMPGFCLLMGGMIDSVGGNKGSFDMLGTQAKWMISIGAGVFLFSFAQIALFSIFSENISFKIKVEYFK